MTLFKVTAVCVLAGVIFGCDKKMEPEVPTTPPPDAAPVQPVSAP